MKKVAKCPSPSCNGRGVIKDCFYGLGDHTYYVECQMCGVRGPATFSPEVAVERWNTLSGQRFGRCPSLGCDGIGYLTSHTCGPIPNRRHWYIQCDKCEIRGPADESLPGAIQGWRAVQDALSVSGDDRWISVEDQLPLTEKRVFVKTVSGTITFGILRTRKNNEVYKWQYLCCADDPDVNEWHSSVTNARNGCITHWRPLPNLPKPVKPDSTSGWISVGDRLPEIDRCVVVRVTGVSHATAGYLTSDVEMWTRDGIAWRFQVEHSVKWGETVSLVTHWKPLSSIPVCGE